jgi:O-antigen/teichoic acid export membrane protein
VTVAAFRRKTAGARNVAASYLGSAAEGAVFLLLTPFLVRKLGLAAYGMWGLAVSLADWIPLLDLGLREALLKYVAAHQAKSDAAAARRTIEAVAFFYLGIGVAAAIGVVAVSWWVLPHFVTTGADLRNLRLVFAILGASAVVGVPASVMGSLLEGLQRFDVLNALRAAHQTLRFALVVIAIQLGWGVVGVAAADLVARLGLHVGRFLVIRRIHPELVPIPRPHRGEIDRLFHLGLWNALRQAADVASLRVFEPILAAFGALPEVGAFYAGRRFAAVPAEAIVPLAGVLLPLSSEMQAEGRHDALKRTLLETTKLALVVSVPFALIIGIGAPIIQNNGLSGRAPGTEVVMTIFSAVFVAVAAFLPSEAVLIGLGNSRLVSLCTFAQLVLTIGLGVPFAARWGAPGLAVAALIATLLTQVAIQIPAAAAACGVSWKDGIVRAFVPALVGGIPVGAAMYFVRDWIAVGGLAGLAVWSVGALLLYAAICWRFALSDDERLWIRSHVSRIVAGDDEEA